MVKLPELPALPIRLWESPNTASRELQVAPEVVGEGGGCTPSRAASSCWCCRRSMSTSSNQDGEKDSMSSSSIPSSCAETAAP